MSSQDTEITLGTGKMLGLFFGLVGLCGLFFGLGFSLGRGSVHTMLHPEQAQAATGAPALRPSAMKSSSTPAQPSEGMTFYKAVEEKDPSTTAVPDAPKEAPAKDAADGSSKATPPDPLTATAASGYFVQVAAVSKQDDAQALVDALKKKQYVAFASNASQTDKFFHVQVGPFGDLKDAEATRAKLISDGYNPILKK
ncbi:MAG TPA: SPOR domain-containing protein [Terriglobales bacterium]|nr:SPOR domain-containing protein [Terriglobales bacterium]